MINDTFIKLGTYKINRSVFSMTTVYLLTGVHCWLVQCWPESIGDQSTSWSESITVRSPADTIPILRIVQCWPWFSAYEIPLTTNNSPMQTRVIWWPASILNQSPLLIRIYCRPESIAKQIPLMTVVQCWLSPFLTTIHLWPLFRYWPQFIAKPRSKLRVVK